MNVLRSIGLGTSANAIGQIAQLAFIPFVTRQVTPEIYGNYMVFLLAAAIAALLSGLQYNSAIVLCVRPNAALAVATLVGGIGALVWLAIVVTWLVVVWALPPSEIQSHAWALFALSLYCAANTFQRIAMAYEVRSGGFQSTALSNAANALGTIAVQWALLAHGRDGLAALVWGAIAGQAFSLMPLLWRLKNLLPAMARGQSDRRLMWAARRYARFPRYMLLFALNGALRDRLVQILVGSYSTAGSLGKLALAQRLTAAPQSLLHQGVSPVLFSYASHHSRADTAKLAASLVELVFVTLAPAFVVVALELPALSSGLLGPKWHGIEAYIGWLMVPSLLLVSTSFVDRLFDVFKSQKQLMLLESTYTAVLLLSLVSICEAGESAYAVQAYAFIFTLYLLACIYMAFHVNDLPLNELWRAARSGAIAALPYAVVLIGAHRVLTSGQSIVFGVVSFVAYGSLYWAWRGRENVRLLRTGVGR